MSNGLIFKQIAKVMNDIEAISKSRDNKQQGFKFRGIDDVMNELHPTLKKHGVFIVPEVLEEKREERQTRSGGMMTSVILKIKYTFFAEDGSSVSAIMIGEGSDAGDKASNKAQSIAFKYVCLQVFAIPTQDEKDPDAQSPEFKPTQTSAPQARNAMKSTRNQEPTIPGTLRPGEWVVNFGTTEKGYKGMTIREAVDRDGLPKVENYINRIIDSTIKDKKPVDSRYREMQEELNAYKAFLANQTQSEPDFMPDGFDTAFDVAKRHS